MMDGTGRGWWMAVAVVVLLGGCGLEDRHRPWFHDEEKDVPEFSGVRLGDSWEEGSVASLLRPEEREALRRSGTGALRASDLDEPTEMAADGEDEVLPDESSSGFARGADKAGKMAVSALAVGVSVGMAIAPFFLF